MVTRRLTRAPALLCALAALTLGALALTAPGASASVVIGISDQNPAFFADPRFAGLGARVARLVVPWDAMGSARLRRSTKDWLAAAAAAGVTPLVSFSGTGSATPTVSAYASAVRAFIARFPTVHEFTAWNEPDWIWRPLARNPARAAAYFDALQSSCHRCTVAAGDVYLDAVHLRPWLAQYVHALHHRPAVWALHDYYDVRDHSTAQLRVVQSLTHGQIWLDETGGVERRGNWRPASPARAAGDERYLLALPARYHRITRVYHYQWRANTRNGWDSGLLGLDGRPRPAYWAIRRANRR